jgi:hypothetical protein
MGVSSKIVGWGEWACLLAAGRHLGKEKADQVIGLQIGRAAVADEALVREALANERCASTARVRAGD